mgnify:FL=1
MKRSLHAARPALTVLAALAAAPALANPGLLHKHARSLGAPMALPGQASGAVTAAAGGATVTVVGGGAAPVVTTTTLPAANDAGVVTTVVAGNAAGSIGVVGVAPGMLPVPIDATAIDPGMGVDGGPVCIMVPIDGDPAPIGGAVTGGPVHIHHRLAPGAVGGSPGIEGLPADGVVDPGRVEPGLVTIMPFPVDAIPIDGTGTVDPATAGAIAPTGFVHAWRGGPGGEGIQPLATATATALPAAAPNAAALPSARAGGLPARAAGVRGDAVSELHRHRPASAPGATAASGTAPAPGDGGASAAGSASAVAAGVARAGAAPAAAGASGAAASPRWRDRLRIAWPGAK